MVNGKENNSSKKFFARNSLAKQLGVHVTVVEKLLFRDVFVPDAWVVKSSLLEDPLFDASRLEELKGTLNAYNAKVAEARRMQFVKK